MKKTLQLLLALLLVFSLTFSFIACDDKDSANASNDSTNTGVWSNAIHLKDMTFGEGEKTIFVEVKAEEQSITFTVKTNADMLGDALLEHSLITGEEGPYGLYITSVNGISAVWEVNQSYWALYSNSEYLMTGIDSTPVENGKHYELVYTK